MSKRSARPGAAVATVLFLLAWAPPARAEQLDWGRVQPAVSPGATNAHAMAYDARNQVVLFGGNGSPGSTWLWKDDTWRRPPPGLRPADRTDHAMAYDSARGRTVLFGGFYLLGDTWEWDGSAWIRRSPPDSPSPRHNHAMAYDADRARTVLFGGSDGTLRNDTWEWDGTTWTLRNPSTSPSARHSHAMAYDSLRRRVVLFGGYNGSHLADTWGWDGVDWTRLSESGPVARYGHAMAFDEARGRTVLYGGFNETIRTLGDTWEWDGAGWSQLGGFSIFPGERSRHGMAHDTERGRTVLFGGVGTGADTGTWLWALYPSDRFVPSSAFTTPNGAVLLDTPLTPQAVTGVTDDDVSGVLRVVVTYTSRVPGGASTEARARVECADESRLHCTWSAPLPVIPGPYEVGARATDRMGRTEEPGPRISIVVI